MASGRRPVCILRAKKPHSCGLFRGLRGNIFGRYVAVEHFDRRGHGDPALAFCQRAIGTRDISKQQAEGLRPSGIIGNRPPPQRVAHSAGFQRDPRARLLGKGVPRRRECQKYRLAPRS